MKILTNSKSKTGKHYIYLVWSNLSFHIHWSQSTKRDTDNQSKTNQENMKPLLKTTTLQWCFLLMRGRGVIKQLYFITTLNLEQTQLH